MGGDHHRALDHAQLSSHFGILAGGGPLYQRSLQRLEQSALPLGIVLLAQPQQNLIEQRPCPALLEDAIRRHVVHRFDSIACLGIQSVQGKDLRASAPFLGLSLVVLVGKKMLERRQQKGAKLTLRAIHVAQAMFLDQPREELLGQILRALRRLPLSPHIGIQWKPINPRQFLQCPLPQAVRIQPARGQHDTPPRRRKAILILIAAEGCRGGGHVSPFFRSPLGDFATLEQQVQGYQCVRDDAADRVHPTPKNLLGKCLTSMLMSC